MTFWWKFESFGHLCTPLADHSQICDAKFVLFYAKLSHDWYILLHITVYNCTNLASFGIVKDFCTYDHYQSGPNLTHWSSLVLIVCVLRWEKSGMLLMKLSECMLQVTHFGSCPSADTLIIWECMWYFEQKHCSTCIAYSVTLPEMSVQSNLVNGCIDTPKSAPSCGGRDLEPRLMHGFGAHTSLPSLQTGTLVLTLVLPFLQYTRVPNTHTDCSSTQHQTWGSGCICAVRVMRHKAAAVLQC